MNSLQVRYYPYGVSGYDSLIISQSKISHSDMASGTPKPDGSQTQNPTVPNGSEPTMVPK